MTEDAGSPLDRDAYGIIFCGAPGKFTVWRLTPGAEVMDREGAEIVGQLAVRAGVSDYRIFGLNAEEVTLAIKASTATHGGPRFMNHADRKTRGETLAQVVAALAAEVVDQNDQGRPEG